MNKGGLLIRLIDVAMIILFGFIIISRLKMSEIELPSTAQQATVVERHIVKVKVIRDNATKIDRYEFIDNSNGSVSVKQPEELESILVGQYETDRNADVQLVVLIEPERESMIQHTVDVLDMCTKHGIPKNITYESPKL
ncbi:biopolymer transporter ExbD [candidate division KSB1 bacterium]|nr:biopolymer transporter ExbD [candidate division KSB1 bacterium]